MSEEIKNTGGSAFPVPVAVSQGNYKVHSEIEGMTLRDYFAAKALAAMIGLGCKNGSNRGAAGVPILTMYAYEYADAMIAERDK
jgi:hypothetical protein